MIKIFHSSGRVQDAGYASEEILELDGKPIDPDVRMVNDHTMHVILNNRSYTVELLNRDSEDRTVTLRVNGKSTTIKLQDKYDQLLHELGMDAALSKKAGDLKAPMPGLVVEVSVEEGSEVKKGDKLLVLEAMKMENILKAAADGVVKKVYVENSNAVEKNQVLIEFK